MVKAPPPDWHEDPFAPSTTGKPGAWVVTFADLMALLMCFFVLLLTYSEMDADKFKQIAASLQESLGSTPIAPPVDTPAQAIIPAINPAPAEPTPPETDENTLAVQVIQQKLAALVQETREDALQLRQNLAPQLENNALEIEAQGRSIIIRLPELGNFESGAAELTPQSKQLLNRIRPILLRKPGLIQVQGHTDDNPIKTLKFRSNWELSSVRAVAVAEALMAEGDINPARFEVTGLASTHPLASNTSEANRARNRRVEIVIAQDLEAALTEADKTLLEHPKGQELLQQLQLPPRPTAKPLPPDIF